MRLDFDEFGIQPPLLGNCIFDMFYVGANGKYPLVCGDNSGHHLYLNVEGRATTDLTFIINELQVIIIKLYNFTRTTTSLSRCLLLVLTLFCPGWGYLNIYISVTALTGAI